MKNVILNILALLLIAGVAFSSSTGFSRCVVDSDCDSGDVCILGDCYTPLECRADSECGENEVCYRGICIAPVCIVSAECPTDFICDKGECIPKECVGDSYCSPGKKCVNYECVGAPTPMALENETEEKEEPKPAVSLEEDNCNCPVCKCACNCQPCEKCPACPELSCPACGPFDGELEIPILLFGLVVVAAIGFFAGKMGGDSDETGQLEKVKSSNEETSPGEEPDMNDEASFRYI